jgi:hypothetical protein
MKNTLSVIGTGVIPFELGSGLIDRNRIDTYQTTGTCPVCRQQTYGTSQLYREYLSILYVPIFPLGLASCMAHCIEFRIRLDRYDKKGMLSYMNKYPNSDRNIGSSGTWWKAFLYSVFGFLIGYFALSYIFGVRIAVFLPILAVISIVLGFSQSLKMFVLATYGVATTPFSSDLKERQLGTVKRLYIAAHNLAPLLAFGAFLFFTAYLGPTYPHIFGVLWGMYLVNSVFLTKSSFK